MIEIDKKIEEIHQSSFVYHRGGQDFYQTDLSVVQSLFDLAPMEQFSLADETCWLAGGSLLRWISIVREKVEPSSYDYDFFSPSRRDLIRMFEQLVRCGYRISYFNFRKRKFIRRSGLKMADLNISLDSADVLLSHEGIREIMRREDLVTIELKSLDGMRVQLIVGFSGYDPIDIISGFDFSICQLATDGRYLYSGRRTWYDLFYRRLRHIDENINLRTSWRFYKFVKMGYRPTVRSMAAAMKSLAFSPLFIGR